MIRGRDWAPTPLGCADDWPICLRVIVAAVVTSPVPMAVLWGADGITLYNDAFAALIGARHPALLGQETLAAWPEARALNERVFATVYGRGESLSFRDMELTVQRGGGAERIWANLDYSPVLDVAGKPCGVLAIVTETTHRVLAKRAIAEQHERLREMFEQAPAMIALLHGPDHVFTLANQAYRRLSPSGPLTGRPAREVHPELVGQGIITLLDRVYRSGEPFIGEGMPVQILDAAGHLQRHHIDFIYQPVRDGDGTITGIFAQGTDVSERVRIERQLREREAHLHGLNEALIKANDILAANA
jgi:PAS domain S-box-containing protein